VQLYNTIDNQTKT